MEPIPRPDLDRAEVTLAIPLTRTDYKILEMLHDDVTAYIAYLVHTHAQGQVKSAERNAKQKAKHNAKPDTA